MTKVQIDLRRQTGAGDVPLAGYLRISPVLRRVASDGGVTYEVLPTGFAAAPQSVIDVTPSVDGDGVCAYAVVEEVPGGRRRWVLVPDSADIVAYSDLAEVDPATLEPSPPALAGWEAVLAQVAEQARVATAGASSATQAAAWADEAERGATDAATAAGLSADTAAQAVADYLTANPPAAAPDATTAAKGLVRLAGDLGGTADAPTVPGLADKADTGHTHTVADVIDYSPPDLSGYATTTALASGLSGKAGADHTHDIGDVSGLQEALDDKQPAHTHDDRYFTETEADGRFVRTVNGTGPDGSGNVAVSASGRAPIDTPALDATYGDDFTAGSLAAKWTRINLTSAEESYAEGASASSLRVDMSGGVAFRGYTQPAPVGDFEAIVSMSTRTTVNAAIFGLALLRADDSGVGAFTYNNPGLFAGLVGVGGVYGSTVGTGLAGSNTWLVISGHRVWLRVRLIAGVGYYDSSLDGDTWFTHHSAAITGVTKVGIVRVYGTPAVHVAHIDRFNMRSI